MKVYYAINQIKKSFRNSVVAIGVFDGLHRGHQKLIKEAVSKARSKGGRSIVFTFDPHPVCVLRPEVHLPMIVSLPYRLKLIESLGVDICVVVKFTDSFSHLSPEQFIQKHIIKKFKATDIFVGYDFRFGEDRCGTLDLFASFSEKYGFDLNVVSAVRSSGKPISSTDIRNKIVEGKLHKAAQLLGRPVSILGNVIRGEARGKSLGFPTANINPTCEVLPPCGVYAVCIYYRNKKLYGMANVGIRPFFNQKDHHINIEVYIFRFNKKIYGKEIVVEFIKKMREERTFNSKEALIRQLQRDEKKAGSLLRAHGFGK